MDPAVKQVQGGESSLHPGAFGPHVSLFLVWQDTERFRARSQELERKLLSKEQELEQLVQKQKRVSFPPHPQRTQLSTLSSPLFLPTFPALHLRT